MSTLMTNSADILPLEMPSCETCFPLAAEQRGLWYVQQLAPDCGAYHLVFSFEVCKRGDWPVQLNSLLSELIADYPVLRTSLPATPDGPKQYVWNTTIPDVRCSDAYGMDSELLRAQLRQDTRQPFNLEQPPLWRIHSYRIDEDRWIVAVVAHHVLLDFWSLGLLLQDVAGRLGLTEERKQMPDGIGFGEYAIKQEEKLAEPRAVSTWLKY